MLWSLSALVIAAGGLAEAWRAIRGPRDSEGYVAFFSLSYEQNLPTYYSSVLLLLCALLLVLIASGASNSGERHLWHWHGLALGFAYMSLDEAVEIHEFAGGLLQLSGVLYFSWVVPAAVVVIVLALLYIPFLRSLDRRTRMRFLIAGAVYVAGALLMELPLGYWTEHHGSDSTGYAAIDFVEEALEIIGVSLFLTALADYVIERGWRFRPT